MMELTAESFARDFRVLREIGRGRFGEASSVEHVPSTPLAGSSVAQLSIINWPMHPRSSWLSQWQCTMTVPAWSARCCL